MYDAVNSSVKAMLLQMMSHKFKNIVLSIIYKPADAKLQLKEGVFEKRKDTV